MAASPLAADLAAAVAALPVLRRKVVVVAGAADDFGDTIGSVDTVGVCDTVDIGVTTDSTDAGDDGGESTAVSTT